MTYVFAGVVADEKTRGLLPASLLGSLPSPVSLLNPPAAGSADRKQMFTRAPSLPPASVYPTVSVAAAAVPSVSASVTTVRTAENSDRVHVHDRELEKPATRLLLLAGLAVAGLGAVLLTLRLRKPSK